MRSMNENSRKHERIEDDQRGAEARHKSEIETITDPADRHEAEDDAEEGRCQEFTLLVQL